MTGISALGRLFDFSERPKVTQPTLKKSYHKLHFTTEYFTQTTDDDENDVSGMKTVDIQIDNRVGVDSKSSEEDRLHNITEL